MWGNHKNFISRCSECKKYRCRKFHLGPLKVCIYCDDQQILKFTTSKPPSQVGYPSPSKTNLPFILPNEDEESTDNYDEPVEILSDNEKEQSDQAAEESDCTTNKSSAGESSIFDFSDHEDKEEEGLSMVPPVHSTVYAGR